MYTKQSIQNQIFQAKLSGKHWLSLLGKNKKILDVGCGNGEILENYGNNAYGIDINDEALSQAKERRVTAVKASATNLPFTDNSFDIVINMNLIEHLYTEQAYELVKEAGRTLKKGGLFIVKTEVVTPRFWNTFSHTRPYPPGSLIKITNDKSQETFPKIKTLSPLYTLYEADWHPNPVWFAFINLLSQYLPPLRRSYMMFLQKN